VAAAVLFIAIALAQRAVAFGAFYLGENVGWKATNALREDLTLHCLRLDLPFHKQHTPGELIERIDGDVTVLANFFSQFAVSVLGNALLLLGILVVLFRIDVRLGLGLGLYIVLAFVALAILRNVSVARWGDWRQSSAEGFGYLEERITGTEDIRGSGAEGYVLRRLEPLLRSMLEKRRGAELLGNLTFVSHNFLYVLGYAVGLGLGAFLYTQGRVTIGTAYLIVFYLGMVAGPLENLREQTEDLQQASASIGRIRTLLGIQPDVRQAVTARLPAGRIAVELEDVSFSYDAGESVLREVSLRLEPGQVLGLLGRTGSGKTTLSRLLFRLYDPSAGSICLGGVDSREVALDDLRQRVGMVTQDVQLFHASVRDNLTFFDERIADARILQALEALGLGGWYAALPNGLDTPLAAGGHGLSAGEAQLLAFTRVFLKDPGLVVLDEASSRLDPATERLLERAMDWLLRDRTGILIAHRLQTVQRADVIAILEDGRLIEYGPRERLASDPTSRFSHLLQTGLEEALA
jgi:ABC-type multidrug transport system fused ATPase/permease subunit